MFSDNRARRGFTLLGVVCTLIILGVLGGLVFSGFSSALTGYAQMRASAATYMQAELALIRLRKEVADVFDAVRLGGAEGAAEGADLSFGRPDGTAVRLDMEGKNLMLKEGERSGPLLGGVTTGKQPLFTARYPEGSILPDLITVTFTLDAPAGPKPYSLAISPRNTPPAKG